MAGGAGSLHGEGVIRLGPEVEETRVREARFCGAEIVDREGGFGEGDDRGEAEASVRVVGIAEGEDGVGCDRFEREKIVVGRRERRNRGVCCIMCGQKCGQSSPPSSRRRSERGCERWCTGRAKRRCVWRGDLFSAFGHGWVGGTEILTLSAS